MQAEGFFRFFQSAVLSLVCAAVAAGAEPWTIRGTVVDENSKPVEGAVVKIENKARLYIRSYITREDGGFLFTGLNRNTDYSIRAQKDRRRSSRTYLSRFRSRTEPRITLRLPGEISHVRPPQMVAMQQWTSNFRELVEQKDWAKLRESMSLVSPPENNGRASQAFLPLGLRSPHRPQRRC